MTRRVTNIARTEEEDGSRPEPRSHSTVPCLADPWLSWPQLPVRVLRVLVARLGASEVSVAVSLSAVWPPSTPSSERIWRENDHPSLSLVTRITMDRLFLWEALFQAWVMTP